MWLTLPEGVGWERCGVALGQKVSVCVPELVYGVEADAEVEVEVGVVYVYDGRKAFGVNIEDGGGMDMEELPSVAAVDVDEDFLLVLPLDRVLFVFEVCALGGTMGIGSVCPVAGIAQPPTVVETSPHPPVVVDEDHPDVTRSSQDEATEVEGAVKNELESNMEAN